jgi:hypothetical protein
VTGRDDVGPAFVSEAHERSELDLAVASRTGIGRPPLTVFAHEIRDDALGERI